MTCHTMCQDRYKAHAFLVFKELGPESDDAHGVDTEGILELLSQN